MEISGNNFKQPVNFYTAGNADNNFYIPLENENQLSSVNFHAGEFLLRGSNNRASNPVKRKRKSKRLNTLDCDYLPDEDIATTLIDKEDNFFIDKKNNAFMNKFKNLLESFYMKTPLINYFFLKQKQQKIQKTVETLNDISQNVDELMNSTIPTGEETELYSDIVKNLTNAASILGKANKEL